MFDRSDGIRKYLIRWKQDGNQGTDYTLSRCSRKLGAGGSDEGVRL
jgi:hypothetical protein